MKKALITGMAGKGDAYLAKFLLDKGYGGLRHLQKSEHAELLEMR